MEAYGEKLKMIIMEDDGARKHKRKAETHSEEEVVLRSKKRHSNKVCLSVVSTTTPYSLPAVNDSYQPVQNWLMYHPS
jgi:hypothetical protein